MIHKYKIVPNAMSFKINYQPLFGVMSSLKEMTQCILRFIKN